MDDYIKIPIWLLTAMKEFATEKEMFDCIMSYISYQMTGEYKSCFASVIAIMKVIEHFTPYIEKEKDHE